MATNQELLASYIRDRSQEAFRELVGRHLDLVYASARRQLGNEALAQDVTQAVFIMLDKKAASLRADVILPAWLLTATWYACKNALRREHRRRVHERGASSMRRETVETPAQSTSEVGAALDEALMSLREADRAPLVLHYLQGQTFNEMAAALQTTPEAARKRADRALVKLRLRFARQGIELAAPAAVEPYLMRAAAVKAPAALRAKAGAATVAGGGAAATIAAAALGMMTTAKAMLAVLIVLPVLLAIGGVIIASATGGNSERLVKTTAMPAGTTGLSAPRDALTRLSEAVRNGDGQAAKNYVYVAQPSDYAALDEGTKTIRLIAEFKAQYRKTFGDAEADRIPALSDTLFDPVSIPPDAPVRINGDRAVVQIFGQNVPMINDAGQWKVPLSAISISAQMLSSEEKAELSRQYNVVYAELTQAIAEGKFDTPTKALAELQLRRQQVRDAVIHRPRALRMRAGSRPTTSPISSRQE